MLLRKKKERKKIQIDAPANDGSHESRWDLEFHWDHPVGIVGPIIECEIQ